MKSKDRLLRGAMRVGLVAKGLILKGDQQLELVLLCAAKPSVAMLKDVAEKLSAQLEVERSVDCWSFFLFPPRAASQKCCLLLQKKGAAAGRLHSEPVSRRRGRRRDEHQVDADAHRPHDVAHHEDGGRRWRGRERRCVPRCRRSVWCLCFSACRHCAAPLTCANCGAVHPIVIPAQWSRHSEP